MKTQLHPMELAPLADFINDCYDGDAVRLCHDLCEAVYLLHLVRKDQVDAEKIENISFTLHQVS